MGDNGSFQVNNVNANAPNNGKGYITYCSRCGGEMYSNSRYCMKCGNLNPDHPDNKGVSKFLEKKGTGYSVGSGQSLIKKENTILNRKATATAVGENTGGFTLCFVVNMVLYCVLAFGSIFYYYLLGRGDLISIISSNLGTILLNTSILFFYLYSLELVFMKMNKCWWHSLIPIFNFYELSDAIIGSNSIITKLTLIPVIGQVLWLYVLYKMGPCFKKSGILMVLAPFLMIPAIAFDGSSYYGTYYTSGENRMEDEFRMKRFFLFLVLLVGSLSVGAIVYTNGTHLKNQSGKLDIAFIIDTTNIVIKDVKNKVEANNYTCDYDQDVFYFHYQDVSEDFHIPFAFAHAPIEAYVKVEKQKNGDVTIVGKYNYYISVTDGTNGFPLTLAREVKNDTVVLYDELDTEYDDGNDCYLHKKS